ncbi:unnamed protein product [Effrenium voratum]|nr:unnamed protein product [Effrenium voratum]
MAKSFEVDQVVLNTLMDAAAQAQEWVFCQALMFGLKQYSVQPTQESFGSLLHACAKAGKSAAAIEVLAEMQSQQVAPDVVAMSSMVHAFARNGKATKNLTSFRVIVLCQFRKQRMVFKLRCHPSVDLSPVRWLMPRSGCRGPKSLA